MERQSEAAPVHLSLWQGQGEKEEDLETIDGMKQPKYIYMCISVN